MIEPVPILNKLPVLQSLFGCLALVQIGFLPGYLLVRSFRWADGELQTFLLSFATGLLLNFHLVWLLVALGIYTTPVVLAVFVLEAAAALFWVHRRPAPEWTSDKARITEFGEALWRGSWLMIVGRLAALMLAGHALYGATLDVSKHWGDIFSVWDEVTSWNRWALEWADNGWPNRTMSYPQLLPANLSLTYLFVDTDHLWMFAKALMPMFPLCILLLLLDLALRTKEYGYVLAIPVVAYLLQTSMDEIRLLGYADAPLAFMVCAALYVCILEYERTPDGVASREERGTSLAPILAAGAALIKVSGWLTGLVLLLVAWRWRKAGKPGRPIRPWLKRWLLLFILIPMPWYAFSETRLVTSLERQVNANEVLIFSHRHRGPIGRVDYGLKHLARNGGVTGVFLFGLALTALDNRRWRWTALGGYVCAAVWAFTMSYDARNLSMAVPFLGVAAGMGGWAAVREPTRWRLAMLLVAAGLAVSVNYPADVMAKDQQDRQSSLGVPEVNEALLTYMQEHGFEGKVLSNYNFMEFNPRLSPYYVHEFFHDLASFRTNLATIRPKYILYSREWCDPPILQFIDARVASGEYTLIMKTVGFWNLIRIESEAVSPTN